LDTLGGTVPAQGGGFFGGGASNPHPTLVQLINRLLNQLGTFDNGDVAPTAAMIASYQTVCSDLANSLAAWRAINGGDLTALNAALRASGRTPLARAVVAQAPVCAR
jgi:hypothetical protein